MYSYALTRHLSEENFYDLMQEGERGRILTTKFLFSVRIQAKTSYAKGVRYLSESTTGPIKLSYF